MRTATLRRLARIALGVLAWPAAALAGPPGLERPTPAMLQAPRTETAPGLGAVGMEAVFYDGLPWKGKPTRVFAYIGMPRVEPGRKVPGIVLVHGGGGTAFAEWVRLWIGRGHAAIAMDTCGTVPRGSYAKWERHDAGGPPGPDFATAGEPVADQWPYHAVADVILAHSLLRSRPDVDPDRIGLTGISWGGYLACLASGLDDRLRFVAPVYGCGFLGENSTWKAELDGLGDRGRLWLDLWDPSHYVARGKMPKLFVSGTNDFAYPLDSLLKTVHACGGTARVTIRPNMPHGHGGPGEQPEELRAFADSVVNGGRPLPTLVPGPGEGAYTVVDGEAVVRAEVVSAGDPARWVAARWKVGPAELAPASGAGPRALRIPPQAGPFFVNLADDRGAVFTGVVSVDPPKGR